MKDQSPIQPGSARPAQAEALRLARNICRRKGACREIVAVYSYPDGPKVCFRSTIRGNTWETDLETLRRI